MKRLIKHLLRESLVSNDIIAYHGSKTKITKFSNKFVGGKDAMDQEGPGIYFTTIPSEAKAYADGGGYVYKVNLKLSKLVSNISNNNLDYLTKDVVKLIKLSPNWKRVARGYSDDLEDGLEEMIYSYIGMSQSEKEVFVSIYNDIYKSTPTLYLKNIVKLGYSGVDLPINGGGSHIAVYNPKTITILGSKKID